MSNSLLKRIEALEALLAQRTSKVSLDVSKNTEPRIVVTWLEPNSYGHWGTVQSSHGDGWEDRLMSEWAGLDVRTQNCVFGAGFMLRGELLYALENGFEINKVQNLGKKSISRLVEWLNTPLQKSDQAK